MALDIGGVNGLNFQIFHSTLFFQIDRNGFKNLSNKRRSSVIISAVPAMFWENGIILT
jgi:hypothetical protein